jgi:hypothetical protein
LSRGLVGLCFGEERAPMLVTIIVVNIVKFFKLVKEWTIVFIGVDNGRMVFLPLRGWIFPCLWRWGLYCPLLRSWSILCYGRDMVT